MTIINRSLANAVVLTSQENFCLQYLEKLDLKIFFNELIKTIGVINTSVKLIDWVAENVNVTVVEDVHRPIIGRNCFPQLGLSLTQTKVSNNDQNQCVVKKQLFLV